MSDTSNVSLRQFHHVANQNPDGDVRLSRQQDGLVNKGSLGQKIATFFTSIGEGISRLFGGNTESTQAQRQKDTLEGFSKALRSMYGDDIANDALRDANIDLDDETTQLSGRTITQVIDTAKRARDEQIEVGRGVSVNRETYQEVLDDLRTSLRPKVIKDLEDERKTPTEGAIEKRLAQYEETFTKRLQDRCRLESDLFRNELSSHDVRYLARQEAEKVVSIEEKGVSFGVRIRELTVKDQSVLLFTGEDKERALKQFVINTRALDEQGGLSNVSIKSFALSTFARDLSELIRNGDESTLKDLGKVQHEMLQQGSFLMNVYNDESTDMDTRSTIEGLVGAMARIMGPVTDSVEGDIARIKDHDDNG